MNATGQLLLPECVGEPELEAEADCKTYPAGTTIRFRGPEVQATKNMLALKYLTNMSNAIYGRDPDISHGMEECDVMQDPVTMDEDLDIVPNDDDIPNCPDCAHFENHLHEQPCCDCEALTDDSIDSYFCVKGAPVEELSEVECANCDYAEVMYNEWPCRECTRNAAGEEDAEYSFYFESGLNETE